MAYLKGIEMFEEQIKECAQHYQRGTSAPFQKHGTVKSD